MILSKDRILVRVKDMPKVTNQFQYAELGCAEQNLREGWKYGSRISSAGESMVARQSATRFSRKRRIRSALANRGFRRL